MNRNHLPSTDRLLTLGMALTSDRRAMERRVRGVFARKRSAKGAVALSLLLVLALGFAAFTTACQPGTGEASGADEALTAEEERARAEVLAVRDAALDQSGAFLVPRFGDTEPLERGSWSKQSAIDAERVRAAKQTFLDAANAIFYTNYAQEDIQAAYYRDTTGVRADIWRIDSADGALSGALNAKSLRFISAQCKTIPQKAQHESILAAGKTYDDDTGRSRIDTSAAITRIAAALGITVDATENPAYQTVYQQGFGWGVVDNAVFYLDDGTFGCAYLFGDERLTPYAVAIYPDTDCLLGNVYWRADRGWSNANVACQSPIDFRVGEPDEGDMTREEAVGRYTALLAAAGDAAEYPVPSATFYRDDSGAREGYWCLRSGTFSMNIAARSGRIFQLVAKDGIGRSLDLPAVASAGDDLEAYEVQSKRVLEAALGAGTIQSAEAESVSDDTNCTIRCQTADGSLYEVFYFDRTICTIGYYPFAGNGETGAYENWLADYTFVNVETGEVFLD